MNKEQILKNVQSIRLAKQLIEVAFEDLKNDGDFREYFHLDNREILITEIQSLINITLVVANKKEN